LKKLLSIIFLLLIFSCNSERNIEKIEYEFYPSFLSPITYTIDINERILHQNSKQFKIEGIIQGSKKLINQQYKIDNKTLTFFLKEITSVKLDSSITHKRSVLDGIGFKFNKIDQKNDTISLISVSPKRTKEYEIDYQILDAFFRLANNVINNYRGISLTENIQDYFVYGLPIKQVNRKPVEYRVWGEIYGCKSDNPELNKFLDSLPSNEPIIFDLRNGSFAPCLSSLLKEYEEEKEFFFYGDYYLNQSIIELETLTEQLQEAKNDNISSQVGSLKVRIRETKKYKMEIEKNGFNNKNRFRTKKEVLKTIANKV